MIGISGKSCWRYKRRYLFGKGWQKDKDKEGREEEKIRGCTKNYGECECGCGKEV